MMRPVYRARQLVDVARALRIHRRLRAHDAWPAARLKDHQRDRFLRLVRHAVRNSAFYRRFYAGIRIDETTTPDRLPVIDKDTMMDNYDELVTDRRLTLSDLQAHLSRLERDEYHLGRFRVLSTSGSTGRKGVFAYDRREWSTVLANALRWYDYIGVRPRLPGRVRISAIGADNPVHVSVRMVESGNVGLFAHQRLAVESSVRDLVRALNEFRPDVLLPYPSIGSVLADEQRAGRLHIRPRIVSTHTEALTKETARRMEQAWGTRPYNHYGLSELPTFGTECAERRGIHVFEDLLIAEVVDENNRPVPPGRTGQKLLLTNLYNFTQPIIRYEVSDMLTLSPEPCPCGRPFPLVASIGGRSEDVFHLKGSDDRDVAVPPIAFETALEAVERVARYQVVHRTDGIHVRVVPKPDADRDALSREVSDRVVSRLTSLGVAPPPVHVDCVADIERPKTIGGKIAPVRSEADGEPR